MGKLIYFFSKFETNKRRIILSIFDLSFVIVSIFSAHFISYFNFQVPYKILFIISFSSIPFFYITGQYKSLTKYIGSSYLYGQFIRNLFLLLIISFLIVFLYGFELPFKFLFIFFVILTILISFFRVVLRDLLRSNSFLSDNKNNVAIYGAGSAGAELAASLRLTGKKRIVVFFDDNPKLWDSILNGIPIKCPTSLKNYLGKIDEILLAIPSISKEKRRDIIFNLNEYSLKVSIVPSLNEIFSGKAKIDDLRAISIDDLLGRESNSDQLALINSHLYKKSICITGAGGSIGSELCKKIITKNPEIIILLDNSEYNLYRVTELILSLKIKTKVYSILGSVTDENLIRSVFRKYKVKVLIHAAAYKHVPIIEDNILSGLYNNVISTKILCQISREEKVDNFIMISTDKAVRPANIMGASKRFAEQIVLANDKEIKDKIKKGKDVHQTRFSIVRFGNVLASSGSVIPLFKRQIRKGGPITLTHPEIVRYFMTIEEAASLVLQAGDLAVGGDVFLLDMGEPVKIKDLALQLIKLSGLTLKDEKNNHGDIEIIYSGLRRGEKLYEELLIDGSSMPTKNSKIFRAIEKSINPNDLLVHINELICAINQFDEGKAIKVLHKVVPEFNHAKNL